MLGATAADGTAAWGSAAAPAEPVARPPVAAARRVVVKLGTRVLVDDGGALARERVGAVVATLAALRPPGREVVLVSSGAVGAGRGSLRLERAPRRADLKGTCAAVGQGMLMAFYQQSFHRFGVPCGQLLLGQHDLELRGRALALRQTLLAMVRQGVVPVINENDAVETAARAGGERAFADNDRLAALLAAVLGADLLVLLTDVPGLYDRDPRRHPEARLVERVETADRLGGVAAGGASAAGRGGMRSKLEAALLARRSGCQTVIADGREAATLSHLLAGEAVGTWFTAGERPPALDRWIACAARPRGAFLLDAGAVAALRRGRASLLAAGVARVDGDFARGDVVELRGPDGALAGRALAGFAAEACRRLVSERSRGATLVRRDFIVLEPQGSCSTNEPGSTP
jgi:glutamate 5-kinase